MDSDRSELKRRAALAALDHVFSGTALGLGTGTTSDCFTRGLAEAIAGGRLRDIRCVGSSRATEELARSLGIRCLSPDELPRLDLAVDGADEVDSGLRLIKGGGGALLREKIVAQASSRYIVIADESKLVPRLGRGRLPVEIAVFATRPLLLRFEDMELDPRPRMHDGEWLVTDEGNRIVDVSVPAKRDITDLVEELHLTAGVVETGFFPSEATDVIIATSEGIEHKTRTR